MAPRKQAPQAPLQAFVEETPPTTQDLEYANGADANRSGTAGLRTVLTPPVPRPRSGSRRTTRARAKTNTNTSDTSGRCAAKWCTLNTNPNTRKCTTCGRPVHDVCDAAEQPRNVSTLTDNPDVSTRRPSHAKACSDRCWAEELKAYGVTPKPVTASADVGEVGEEEGDNADNGEDASMEVIEIDSASEEDEDAATKPSDVQKALRNPTFPKFDLSLYEQKTFKADLTAINKPPHAARGLREMNMNDKFVQFVESLGIVKGTGQFAATLKQVKNGPVLMQEVVADKDGKISYELWLIDGRHRLRAVTILSESGTRRNDWKKFLQNAFISLWLRKDGKYLTQREILEVSKYLNSVASNVIVPDTLDHIHGHVSAIQIVHEEHNIPYDQMTVDQLAASFLQNSMASRELAQLPQGSKRRSRLRHITRFAQIALRLAKSAVCFNKVTNVLKDMRKKVKDNPAMPTIGITHLASSILCSMDDPAFCLAVDVLNKRLSSTTTRVGSFEKFRIPFYEAIRALYSQVERVAKYTDIETTKLLDTKVHIAGDESRSIAEVIESMLRDFGTTKSRTEAADRRRLRTLRNRLKDAIGGGDIEPPPEPPVTTPTTAARNGTRTETGDGDGDGYRDRDGDGAATGGAKPGAEDGAGAGDGTGPDAPDASKDTPGPQDETIRRSTRKKVPRINPDENDTDAGTGSGAQGRNKRKRTTTREDRRASKKKKLDIVRREVKGILDGLDLPSLREIFRSIHVGEKRLTSKPLLLTATETAKAEDTFDDRLPQNLPDGWGDPAPYSGEPWPAWTKMARTRPSQWPEKNPIEHVKPFLELVYIRHDHRANVTITDPDVLRANHHFIFWRAAFNFYARNMSDIDLDDPKFQGLAELSDEDKLWAAAFLDDSASRDYFGECRAKLRHDGFCILNGFLDDEKLPQNIGDQIKFLPAPQAGFYKRLRKDAIYSFPGTQSLRDRKNHKTWTSILNAGTKEDEAEGDRGIARYITTNAGVTTAVETDPERRWACSERALLDLRIGQAVAALRAWDNGRDRTNMFIPRTGGRWLLTSKKCKRQFVHSDFESLTFEQVQTGSKCPGFFTICSGDREVPLWVAPGSHRAVARTSETEYASLSATTFMELVKIPPFSIFVGRGDVLHAGAGYSDYPGADGRIRYHMYLVPQNYNLPDGIHLLDIEPTFLEDPFLGEKNSEEDYEDDSDAEGEAENEEVEGEAENEEVEGEEVERVSISAQRGYARMKSTDVSAPPIRPSPDRSRVAEDREEDSQEEEDYEEEDSEKESSDDFE